MYVAGRACFALRPSELNRPLVKAYLAATATALLSMLPLYVPYLVVAGTTSVVVGAGGTGLPGSASGSAWSPIAGSAWASSGATAASPFSAREEKLCATS